MFSGITKSKAPLLNTAAIWVERLSKGTAFLGAAAIIIMMLSVSADILARKFLGKPIPGVVETNELLMVIIIFMGLGITQILGKNVRMDAVIVRVRPGAQRGLHIFITLIVLGLVSLLAWQTAAEALKSIGMREIRFGSIPFPVWPSKLALPIGSILLWFVLLVDLLCSIFPPECASTNEENR